MCINKNYEATILLNPGINKRMTSLASLLFVVASQSACLAAETKIEAAAPASVQGSVSDVNVPANDVSNKTSTDGGTETTSGADAKAAANVSANADADAKAEQKSGHELKGTVSASGVDSTIVQPDALVEDLVASGEKIAIRNADILKKEKHYRGPVMGTVTQVSNLAQFATAYKGFQASSEAADVILEEKMKLKSKPSVELIRQKQHDELHSKITQATMQIAQGLGMTDSFKRRDAIQDGVTQLEGLVGKDEALKALASMKSWSATIQDSTAANPEPMDISHVQKQVDTITVNALQKDPVVTEVKTALHKYNHHSTVMRATAKIVNTGLSVAMFSPTVISPAAQIALMTFLVATGGPEEAKLLKSLYLDRRIETRYKMLTYETTLTVNNYNTALLTKNPVLAAYCVNQAERMGGKDCLTKNVSDNQTASADASKATTKVETSATKIDITD